MESEIAIAIAIPSQGAVTENFCSESPFPDQGVEGTFRKGLIHPEAGFGLFRPQKPHSLNFEFLPYQLIEVLPFNNDVAAVGRGTFIKNAKRLTEPTVSFDFKKSNLPDVVRLVIAISVSDDSTSGDTIHLVNLHRRSGSRRPAEVADIDVRRGKEEVENFHPLR